MPGDSRYLSLTTDGALTQAAFGFESAGGDGTPVLEVCHNMPSGLIALVAVHPDGRAGGVTLSNFWSRMVIKVELGGQGWGVGVGVGVGAAGCISIEPMLMRPLRTRGKPMPR